MSDISFSPSPDVTLVINTLLDKLENRLAHHAPQTTQHKVSQQNAEYEPDTTQPSPRAIKISLADLPLPAYFSQTDPTPRLVANEQFIALEKAALVKLEWLPGESGHILQSITLQPENATRNMEHETRNPPHQTLFHLINRAPLANKRLRLEDLLLAEKFRFVDDWRARALRHTLNQLKAQKSPAPFSLTDAHLNQDLLAILVALPTLQTETPYRAFSVRVFNDSKRLEALKNQLVGLARMGNPEWKSLPAEEVLRELNLVANPGYIHFAGNWQITTQDGEILSLGGFSPSVGFPAAQTAQLQAVQAQSVLCIENLTTFYEFIRMEHATNAAYSVSRFAIICIYGNPSPAVRRVLRLLPESTPIYLWSDLDYGGFNILSQLRRLVSERVQPYWMDATTLEANIACARPLTASDRINLQRLLRRPELRDVRPDVEYLLKRGLKLEQEGVAFA